MEKDGFVKIFGRSLTKYNVMYSKLISDGDSSNIAAIRDSNPYATQGVEVNNSLCVNHIKRNVANSIKALSKKKGNYGKLRKVIENSAPHAIQAINDSVKTVSELE